MSDRFITPSIQRATLWAPYTSCSTNAARSSGDSDSSTTSIAIDTSSAISAACSGPAALDTGSGSHSPTYASRRLCCRRSRLSASRVVTVTRNARTSRHQHLAMLGELGGKGLGIGHAAALARQPPWMTMQPLAYSCT